MMTLRGRGTLSRIQVLCDDEDEFVRERKRSVNRIRQDLACHCDNFALPPFIQCLRAVADAFALIVGGSTANRWLSR